MENKEMIELNVNDDDNKSIDFLSNIIFRNMQIYKALNGDAIFKNQIKTILNSRIRSMESYNKIFDINYSANTSPEEVLKETNTILNTYLHKEIPEDIPSKVLDCGDYFRDDFISIVGYALITKKVARGLADIIGKGRCLEIMAGSGAVTKALRDEGVSVVATDNMSWKHQFKLNFIDDMEVKDCLYAIEKYGKQIEYVIMSWTPYQDIISYEVIEKIRQINPKIKIIYIGESYGGCTACDKFFDNVEVYDAMENCQIPSWRGIHDYITIYKNKRK